MATPVQEKVILSGSDTTVPAPALQAVDVQIPVIPSEAPSLEGGRLRPYDPTMKILETFDEGDNVESETFKKVSGEELREIIEWIRANPALTRANFLQTSGDAVEPSKESLGEDEFVVIDSAAIPDQLAVTANDSPSSLMSRVKRSFWSAVSSFYSSKK